MSEVFNLKIAIIDDEEKDREEVKDALIPIYIHLTLKRNYASTKVPKNSWSILKKMNLTFVSWTFI